MYVCIMNSQNNQDIFSSPPIFCANNVQTNLIRRGKNHGILIHESGLILNLMKNNFRIHINLIKIGS